MFRATPDTDDVDLDLHLATAKRRNPVRLVGRAMTAPFRAVIAVLAGIFGLAYGLIRLVLFPFRLAIGIVRRVVAFAADIVFAVWRVVMFLVALVLGLVGLVFAVLNATIGNAIRLVLKVVFGTLKLVLKIVTLGRFGRAAAVGAAGAAIGSRVADSDES